MQLGYDNNGFKTTQDELVYQKLPWTPVRLDYVQMAIRFVQK